MHMLNVSRVVKKAKENRIAYVELFWSLECSRRQGRTVERLSKSERRLEYSRGKGAYIERLQLSVATVEEAGRYSFLNRKTV